MKQEEYLRKLTLIEVKRHYIYVTKDHRDLFPETGETFEIWLNEEKIEAKLDAQGRFWLGFRAFRDLRSSDTIELTRNPDGTFSLEMIGE